MKDPHVVALHYAIEHHPPVDYGKAKPLDHRESAFDIRVEGEQACFIINEHFATVKEAREAVEEFIRTWEFDAEIENGMNAFKLRFDRPEVEDHNPAPGTVSLCAKPLTVTATMSKASAVASTPSSGLRISLDVKSMSDRFAGYRAGREPITNMAYFCFTVLKASTGPKSRSVEDVAKYYRIHPRVLRQTQGVQTHRHARLQNRQFLPSFDLLSRNRHQYTMNLNRPLVSKAGVRNRNQL